MTTWTISINDELKEAAEKAMKEGKYGNKSEFIRTLIRKFCVEPENETVKNVKETLLTRDKKKDLSFDEAFDCA